MLTFGMDFYWESTQYGEQLVLSGEIKTGDGEKFRSFIKTNFEKYKTNRSIRLASNGGNLVEALKISAILRSIYPDIMVKGEKCASSCFFLYLSGVSRHAEESSLIGIHRAFFDPAYFATLKPNDAKSKQAELQKLMGAILDENQVPQYLKEQLNRTSSADIYWLSDDDIKNIGHMPAWFEELLIAKCEYGKCMALMKKMFAAKDDDPEIDLYPQAVANCFLFWSDCKTKMINKELSKMPKILIDEGASKKPCNR